MDVRMTLTQDFAPSTCWELIRIGLDARVLILNRSSFPSVRNVAAGNYNPILYDRYLKRSTLAR